MEPRSLSGLDRCGRFAADEFQARQASGEPRVPSGPATVGCASSWWSGAGQGGLALWAVRMPLHADVHPTRWEVVQGFLRPKFSLARPKQTASHLCQAPTRLRCCATTWQETSLASTRWSHCGAEDLDVLQALCWSAGASRNALAQRLAYSKSKANAMVAALVATAVTRAVLRPAPYTSPS